MGARQFIWRRVPESNRCTRICNKITSIFFLIYQYIACVLNLCVQVCVQKVRLFYKGAYWFFPNYSICLVSFSFQTGTIEFHTPSLLNL